MKREAGQILRGGQRVDVDVPEPFRLCDCERHPGDGRSVVPTPIELDDRRYNAWSSYLARWSCVYPCRLALEAEKQQLDADTYYLRIAFCYPDECDSRDASSSAPPGGLGLWPPSDLPDDDTPRWIRSNLVYHLVHEMDEHLRLDGAVAFDPHVTAVHMCERCAAVLETEA